MAVSSPLIPLGMKLSRVDAYPQYDPEFGYHNVTGYTPTEVDLGLKGVVVFKSKFRKYPVSYNTIPAGNGNVPIYPLQMNDGIPSHSRPYAPEHKWVKAVSDFDATVARHMDNLHSLNLRRHNVDNQPTGGASLEQTPVSLLQQLIRSL